MRLYRTQGHHDNIFFVIVKKFSLIPPTICLFLELIMVGCVQPPLSVDWPNPLNLTNNNQAQMKLIGIAANRHVAQISYQIPPKGWLDGLGLGARDGALAAIGVGPPFMGVPAPPYIMPFTILLSPVGALVGGIYGAFTAESGTKVEQAEREIKNALVDLEWKSQEIMRDGLFQVLDAKSYTHFSFLNIVRWGRERWGSDRESHVHSLSAQSIDTLLEVSVINIELVSIAGWRNAPQEFRMEVHTELTRTADNESLWKYLWLCQTQAHPFLEWAAKNSMILRQEISNCLSTLPNQIAQILFIQKPSPVPVLESSPPK